MFTTGEEIVDSDISFAERLLFTQIGIDDLTGRRRIPTSESIKKMSDLKQAPLKLSYMKGCPYRDDSITHALMTGSAREITYTALAIAYLEMTDFKKFQECRVGSVMDQNRSENIFLKTKDSIDPQKYNNLDFDASHPDTYYQDRFGNKPKTKPKEYILACILNNGGKLLEYNENYSQALKCYERALEIDPQNELALHKKALALLKIGKNEESLGAFDSAISRLLNYKAEAFSNIGRYEEALKCYDAALEINPEGLHNVLGRKQVIEALKQNPKPTI